MALSSVYCVAACEMLREGREGSELEARRAAEQTRLEMKGDLEKHVCPCFFGTRTLGS